jgi:hypothetical protein
MFKKETGVYPSVMDRQRLDANLDRGPTFYLMPIQIRMWIQTQKLVQVYCNYKFI